MADSERLAQDERRIRGALHSWRNAVRQGDRLDAAVDLLHLTRMLVARAEEEQDVESALRAVLGPDEDRWKPVVRGQANLVRELAARSVGLVMVQHGPYEADPRLTSLLWGTNIAPYVDVVHSQDSSGGKRFASVRVLMGAVPALPRHCLATDDMAPRHYNSGRLLLEGELALRAPVHIDATVESLATPPFLLQRCAIGVTAIEQWAAETLEHDDSSQQQKRAARWALDRLDFGAIVRHVSR